MNHHSYIDTRPYIVSVVTHGIYVPAIGQHMHMFLAFASPCLAGSTLFISTGWFYNYWWSVGWGFL